MTLAVPFAVGSSTDIMTRLVAKGLSERLNAVFIVDNKPGANGTIAVDFVAKARPDGYTFVDSNQRPRDYEHSRGPTQENPQSEGVLK